MKLDLLVGGILSTVLGLFLIALPSCDSADTSTDDFPGDPRILGMWEANLRGNLLFESDSRGKLTQTEFRHIRLPDEECWLTWRLSITHMDENSFVVALDRENELAYEYFFDGDDELRIRLIESPLDFEMLYKRSDKTEADFIPRCRD